MMKIVVVVLLSTTRCRTVARLCYGGGTEIIALLFFSLNSKILPPEIWVLVKKLKGPSPDVLTHSHNSSLEFESRD